MEDDKGIETGVVLLDVKSYPDPVLHAHAAGVQEWIVLRDTVKYAALLRVGTCCTVVTLSGVCACECW